MSGQERYLSMTSFHLIHSPASSALQRFYPLFYFFCIHFPCIPLNHFSVPLWLLYVAQRWLMEMPVDSSPVYSTSHILLFVCLSTILVTRHLLLDFTNVAFLAWDFHSWTRSPSVASVLFLSLIFHALLTKEPYLFCNLAERIHPHSYFCSGNWIGLFFLHPLRVVGSLLFLQGAQPWQRPKDCPFNPNPTLAVWRLQCTLHVGFLYLYILSLKEIKILPTYVCLQLSDFVPPSVKEWQK